MLVFYSRYVFFGLLCAGFLLLQGCTSVSLPSAERLSSHPEGRAHIAACTDFYTNLDQQVDAAGVGDAEQARIANFPYLRVDRFLSSMRLQPMDKVEFDAWVDRLQGLDRQARLKELDNLPQPRALRETGDIKKQIIRCAALLRKKDMADEVRRKKLRAAAIVKPNYQIVKRIFGLYPISSQFVLIGVRRLHEEVAQRFATPLEELPVHGRLMTYTPPLNSEVLNKVQIANIIHKGSMNPLGIPELEARDRERLFATFAPVWEIDVKGDADRFGEPFWSSDPKAQIAIDSPRVYRRLSHTRFKDRIYLQLNYQIWFPGRPRQGKFDILGGHLDGLIWRVTLDENGKPLLYDTIHNCGCYHMYFPSSKLQYTGKTHVFEEPLLIPAGAPQADEGERVVLRIAHSTHYLEAVSVRLPISTGITYRPEDYHTLRSLPLRQGGNRSLFGPDGLVPDTQRGERWVLWPMGIPEPGAMRQWGHHATAFVGRRHFDDPDLLERYFRLIPESGGKVSSSAPR
jgi:hypothetical protein